MTKMKMEKTEKVLKLRYWKTAVTRMLQISVTIMSQQRHRSVLGNAEASKNMAYVVFPRTSQDTFPIKEDSDYVKQIRSKSDKGGGILGEGEFLFPSSL